MIINYLHPVWAIFLPFKANTPLLVDADALLADPISPQGFKAVAGKIHQVLNAHSAIKYLQAPLSLPGNRLKAGNSFAMEKLLGMLACK